MGRVPKPVGPAGRSLPIYPAPEPADYSDEVSEAQLDEMAAVVLDREEGDEENGDEWELVDGPAW